MGMIRKIKRNKARAKMRAAGVQRMNKRDTPLYIGKVYIIGRSYFSLFWRDYLLGKK